MYTAFKKHRLSPSFCPKSGIASALHYISRLGVTQDVFPCDHPNFRNAHGITTCDTTNFQMMRFCCIALSETNSLAWRFYRFRGIFHPVEFEPRSTRFGLSIPGEAHVTRCLRLHSSRAFLTRGIREFPGLLQEVTELFLEWEMAMQAQFACISTFEELVQSPSVQQNPLQGSKSRSECAPKPPI